MVIIIMKIIQMLISKTPYRISLFGGGTDYPSHKINEGEVISASINKYVYISLRVLPNFFDHNYRIFIRN